MSRGGTAAYVDDQKDYVREWPEGRKRAWVADKWGSVSRLLSYVCVAAGRYPYEFPL